MQENEVKKQEQEQEVKKENGFVKYLKGLGYDFVQSFKYNNMKLAGLLVLIPGAIFGFFLRFHTTVINSITVDATNGAQYMLDLSGFMLFIMMLFGILNIFTGFSMMNKKNLGSVILATVTSALMIAAGIFYFVIVFRWMNGVNKYYEQLDSLVAKLNELHVEENDLLAYARRFLLLDASGVEKIEPYTNQSWYIYAIPAAKRVGEYFNFHFVLSLGSVALCIICSVVGVGFGFKNYDRNYEKVDR